MTGRPAGSGRLAVLAAVLAVVCLAVAAVAWAVSGPRPVAPDDASAGAPAAVSPPGTTRPPAPSYRDRPRRALPLPAHGRPQRVAVPSLGVDVPVLPVAMQGTALDPPPDPQVLGWWAAGAAPGAARGSALLVGHTVHAGGGAMDDLEQVRQGAAVRVWTTRGTIAYVVRSVRVLGKAALARKAQRLFSQRSAGRLVLVTCEDWDGSGYRSNVVVTARPRR